MMLPQAVRPDFNSLFNFLLASKADSTAKKYIKEINKFLPWCRARKAFLQLPISSLIVALTHIDGGVFVTHRKNYP